MSLSKWRRDDDGTHRAHMGLLVLACWRAGLFGWRWTLSVKGVVLRGAPGDALGKPTLAKAKAAAEAALREILGEAPNA